MAKMNEVTSHPYFMSEDIDPQSWESVSDAYSDLSVYAYNFIYRSDKYHIPEEYIGDAVLTACERAFKYRNGYDRKISRLHNWFNTIIIRVLIATHNKLPDEQRLDTIINKAADEYESEYEMNIEESATSDERIVTDTDPERNTIFEEVQRIRKDVAEALRNHIENLRPLDRDIFIKAYVDEIPFKVIASQTGLTETAARKRAFDIKKRVRRALPEITPWKKADIAFNKIAGMAEIPLIGSEEAVLLELYPQYDTRNIKHKDTGTIEHENGIEVAYELLRDHLEICFGDYNVPVEGSTDVYSELKAELCRRGRNIREDERLGSDMFIIEDDLDIIVSGHKSLVLYIGFIHKFIAIHTSVAGAKSIADYIDDLHSLIDGIGEKIDSLIDIRS